LDMLWINILIVGLFVLAVMIISYFLNRASLEIQAIVITVLVVIAYFVNNILLWFFRDLFINQWYYMYIYKYGRGYESIILPFIYIGAFVYWIMQKIISLIENTKRKGANKKSIT